MRFVKALCEQKNVPFYGGRVDAPGYARAHGCGLEEAARALRYDFLEKTAEAVGADAIALAHHRGDQAETVLLHAARGSDIRGLCAMRWRRGKLIRPLLDAEPEALRAQAVAARTYALCKLSRGRPDAHPEADLCDDYRHCAAYRSPAVSVFGTDEISAIRAAVRDTEGEILTSEGAPIAAVFHCVSGPRTESAADVWGEDVPYLQSVVSPGGTAFDGYESAVTVSADDFREKVGSAFPAADLCIGSPHTRPAK